MINRCLKNFILIAVLSISTGDVVAQPEQGKIVSLKGKVVYNRAAAQPWESAKLFQNLFYKNCVRTFEASRSDVLFVNEAILKLGPNAILTVQLVTGQAQTSLNLQQGKIWVRTKNPAGPVTINTTGADVKITGTEINVELRSGNETVLTVIEGSAEISNNAGTLQVFAGEEASARPGVTPAKRRVLNPEDAVQWALYYPISFPWYDLPPAAKSGPVRLGFERFRQGDAIGALNVFTPLLNTTIWARIGASMAYAEIDSLELARTILQNNASPDATIEAERHAQLAAVALASGEANRAIEELRLAIQANPRSLRTLTLLSSLKLTQNRKNEARAATQAALKIQPNSVAANIAASEVAQAFFNLEVARRLLDRALASDPQEVHALVNRARIRFGMGDTKGAKQDADNAAAIAPNDAQVLSLLGFINLADGDLENAAANFQSAIERNSELGEPHLGLGLIYFRRDQVDAGLLEMLTATLLEPKVSLYHSYLGKAYYQLQRFREGLSALETAKRLDPRDPTPWLYASLFRRDLNQQTDALNELRQAIALNDNRAVYRSRFLLDRDLATKNVSLAEVYRELGFEAWGASEALNSLHADFTNASAHIFLADNYINLPDRTAAGSSELLQYFLYAPVNRNAFHTFNEYTALLEQPVRRLNIFTEAGTFNRWVGEGSIRGGNERFAFRSYVNFRREDGARPTIPDEKIQIFGQAKLALGAKTDLFAEFVGSEDKHGAAEDVAVTVEPDSANSQAPPVQIKKVNRQRDNNVSNRERFLEGVLGFKHNWSIGSTLTAFLQIQDINANTEDPDYVLQYYPFQFSSLRLFPVRLAVESHSYFELPFRTYSLQVQQVTWLGRRQQFIIGAEGYRVDNSLLSKEVPANLLLCSRAVCEFQNEARDKGFALWLRDEIELSSRFHATLGLGLQSGKGTELNTNEIYNFQKWNPLLGFSWRLGSGTYLRAAAFRNLNTRLIEQTISPTTVAGFIIDRTELVYTDRQEADLSLEYGRTSLFQMVQVFYRDFKLPTAFDISGIGRTRALGINYSLNCILGKRWSFFADNQFVRSETAPFTRDDNQIRVGLNFIHPAGFFARLTNAYLTQRFSNTSIKALENSSYNLTNLEFKYMFPRKHGTITLATTNLFDRRFSTFIEGLLLQEPRPDRHLRLTVDWRF
jgi:tetratricopeptide (TPR) repeat protein